MEPDPSIEQSLSGGLRLPRAAYLLAACGAVALAALVSSMATPHQPARTDPPKAAARPLESWEGKSFPERARLATLVLLTDYRTEGGMVRAYIKEELKREPGTAFDFRVGEEYVPLAREAEANTSYGEGALVLLEGSPAELRESMGILGGNVYVDLHGSGTRSPVTLSEARRIVLESK